MVLQCMEKYDERGGFGFMNLGSEDEEVDNGDLECAKTFQKMK